MNKFAAVLVGIIAFVWLALAAVRNFADGPVGPLPGGVLRTGALVNARDVDWVKAAGEAIEYQVAGPLYIEAQLVEPARSRTTGIMVRGGQAYIPCDLGFGWARFSGPQRWLLHLIYLVKSWHEDAERDGRMVVRIGGQRYVRQAVRVTDARQLEALRLQFEAMVGQWSEPGAWGPAPTQGPRDIWFFRLDPPSHS